MRRNEQHVSIRSLRITVATVCFSLYLSTKYLSAHRSHFHMKESLVVSFAGVFDQDTVTLLGASSQVVAVSFSCLTDTFLYHSLLSFESFALPPSY